MAFRNIYEMDELGYKIVMGLIEAPYSPPPVIRTPAPVFKNQKAALAAAVVAIVTVTAVFCYHKYKKKN